MQMITPQSTEVHPSPIDVSLVERALSLSYEERIDAHESARQLMNDLKKAGEEYRARQSQSPA